MAPIDSSAAEERERQRLEDERARYERIERIELRFKEGRCVDCGCTKHPLSTSWKRCPTCRSLTCRTCRDGYRKGKKGPWQCFGCGERMDERSSRLPGVLEGWLRFRRD